MDAVILLRRANMAPGLRIIGPTELLTADEIPYIYSYFFYFRYNKHVGYSEALFVHVLFCCEEMSVRTGLENKGHKRIYKR